MRLIVQLPDDVCRKLYSKHVPATIIAKLIHCIKSGTELPLELSTNSLIKRHAPLKVNYKPGDPFMWDSATCPECSHSFDETSELWHSRYCPNCGQRLYWGEGIEN